MRGLSSGQPSPAQQEPAVVAPLCFIRLWNKLLKRIPCASRELAAKSLTSVLDTVVNNNDHESWSCVFFFSQHCFKCPRRRKKRISLASVVNSQIRDEAVNILLRSITITPPAPITTTKTKCKKTFGVIGA